MLAGTCTINLCEVSKAAGGVQGLFGGAAPFSAASAGTKRDDSRSAWHLRGGERTCLFPPDGIAGLRDADASLQREDAGHSALCKPRPLLLTF